MSSTPGWVDEDDFLETGRTCPNCGGTVYEGGGHAHGKTDADEYDAYIRERCENYTNGCQFELEVGTPEDAESEFDELENIEDIEGLDDDPDVV